MSHRAGRSQRLSSSAGQRAHTRPAWNTAFGSAAGWRSRSRPLAGDTRRAADRGSESWPGARPRPLHLPSSESATHLPAHGFAPHAACTLPRRLRRFPRRRTPVRPLPRGCRTPEGTSGPHPSASLHEVLDTRDPAAQGTRGRLSSGSPLGPPASPRSRQRNPGPRRSSPPLPRYS